MFYRYLIVCCLCLAGFSVSGQVVTECPQNIGFERGNFENWETYIGEISDTRSTNVNAIRPAVVSLASSGITPTRHTIIPRSGATDYYGGFSLNSPNGSDYVVQLGFDMPGRSAERISYTLTVPANVEEYSIIFNYAVVFENPPHGYDEQPRFTARVFDIASNSTTECGSFEFVAQGGLPDFKISPYTSRNPAGNNANNPNAPAGNNAPVMYKEWSPVLVNLTAYRGRTIRLEFTTNDCSLGGHFGYAYIDFNENCSIPITGNVTCPENQSITLKTLPGFFDYRWYNANTGELLGTADSVVLSPVPPVGTRIAIDLVPYPGVGCRQTLYTTINGMAMNILDPPPDCTVVDLTDIALKVGNSSDLTYSYWMNEAATIPIRDPRRIYTSGRYFIKGRSSSGCELVRPVIATIMLVPALIQLRPLETTYPATVSIPAAFLEGEGMTYTYWMDNQATIPITDPARVGRKGTYYIKSVTAGGCVAISPVNVNILIPDIVAPNTFTPNNDGNNDVFTVLVNEHVAINTFRIFNRWGDVVYLTTDINTFWTGLKDSTEAPVGVYYWVLDGVLDNKKYLRSGYITLIR